MTAVIIRILAPQNSRRGKAVRKTITQIQNRRSINYARRRYNLNRHRYYKYSTTKIIDDETNKISIVVPCYNTPIKYFEPLLSSVFSQGYGNWELVIVDGSDNAKLSDYLEQRAASDTRIKYLKVDNEGIAQNTNAGISQASGEFIAFLDHDDTLDADALAEAVELFNRKPDLGLVYSDEDKISDNGEEYFEPHFKPDFSLDLLRNVNYITHFVVVRKTIVKKLHGIREGYEGAQDYDFLLRVVDEGVAIGHVPKILYHWRQAEGSTAADFSNKSHITDAGIKAINEHLDRRGVKNANAYAIANRPGFYSAKYKLSDKKRYIYVDLENTSLSKKEKEYILYCYKKNNEVKKYEIEVIEGKPEETNHNTLLVRGAFIPKSRSTEIAPLFGLSEEDGVAGVAPLIVSHGRIFDSGIVHINGRKHRLFKGLNPHRQMGFGSLEWVRDVDELSGNAAIMGSNPEQAQRKVIWSHSEFVAFREAENLSTELNNYYNPNIEELTEIVEKPFDHVADLVEVKQ
jgi:glycosyltransferase involved in cell wall biosynthesis